MEWIQNYQLFLFDFDGLLVNTEHIHYRAYIEMCADRGFNLTWDFARYSDAAHHSASGLRDQIYAEFPSLRQQEPDWNVLYGEKKSYLLDLIEKGSAQLMPGVKFLLECLSEAKIKRCVVTNSSHSLIEKVRKQNPILNSIPYWVTREQYTHPKPNPECYQIAISTHAQPGDQIIGFEDSPRGLEALKQTSAKPILVCDPSLSYVQKLQGSPLTHFPSFSAMQDCKQI